MGFVRRIKTTGKVPPVGAQNEVFEIKEKTWYYFRIEFEQIMGSAALLFEIWNVKNTC